MSTSTFFAIKRIINMKFPRSANKKISKEATFWTPMPFSQYKGKTLPEISCINPGWFHWAVHAGVFQYGSIAHEAKIMYRKIRTIRIPEQEGKTRIVRHLYDRHGKYIGFIFELADDRTLKNEAERLRLDFTVPYLRSEHDWDTLLRCFFEYYFDGNKPNKQEAERFFLDTSNFVDPKKGKHSKCRKARR
jgi:hypothetical protein